MGILEKPIVKVLMLKGEPGDVNLEQLQAETNARKNADNILQRQIESLSQGSPLVANSTNEMTDTTRVYVNTTNGKWYYYNGTQWVIGGTYQSAEDSTSVNRNTEKVNSIYETESIVNIDWELGSFSNGTEEQTSDKRIRMKDVMTIPENSTITVSVSNDYYINVAYLDDNTFIDETAWVQGTVKVNSDLHKQFRILIKRSDNGVITLEESSSVVVTFKYFDFAKEMAKLNTNKDNLNKKYTNFIWECGGLINGIDDDSRVSILRKTYRTGINILPYDLILKLEGTEYEANVCNFDNNNTFINESGWFTNTTYTIPANQKFRLTMRRKDDGYSDCGQYINLKCFLKEYDYDETKSFLSFIQGTHNNGTVVPQGSGSRLITENYIDFGDNNSALLEASNGYKFAIISYDNNNNYILNEDFGWRSVCRLYKCDDRKYRILVGRTNNENIVLDTNFEYVSFTKYNKKINNIDKIIDTSFIQTIAHRANASYNEPENNILAVKGSALAGRKYVEIDVRKTSDNKFVCIHDATIDNVSNGTGNVNSYTLDQLYSYTFNKSSWGTVITKYADSYIKISTFEEVVIACKKYGLIIMLDMASKTESEINELYQIIEKHNFTDKVIYSFDTISNLINFHANHPYLPIIYSTDSLTNVSNYYKYFYECQFMITTQWTNFQGEDLSTNKTIVKNLINNGVYTMAFTLRKQIVGNNPTILDDLIDSGIFAIGTNDFDMLEY